MATGPISLRQDWQHTDGSGHVVDPVAYDAAEGVVRHAMLSWDTGTLAWVKFTGVSGGGGGGGGGPATIADGADVTQGAKADATWDGSSAASGISLWRYIGAKLEAIRALLAGTLSIGGSVSVSNLPTTQAVSGPLTDTQLRASAVPVSLATNTPDVTDRAARLLGHVTVDSAPTTAITAAALPLPTNASTSALQTTGNTSVASVDTKTPALGQALAASSVPVVLTALQQAALTPPAAITGYALEAGHLAAIDTSTAKIPALGQALAAASTPVVLPATQITALTPPAAITGYALEAGHLAAIDTHLDVALSTRLKPADTLAGVTTVGAVTAITNALPAGSNTIGKVDQGVAGAAAWKVDGSAVTQPISVAALPLPNAAATDAGLITLHADQTTGNASLASIDTKASALAKETGGNLDTMVARLTSLLGMLVTQGASGASVTGPMVQGLADDSPPYLQPGNVYPLSLTTDGRLRVATAPSNADTDFWSDPFTQQMTERGLSTYTSDLAFF